ncbi:MAG TPA: FAD-binding protein [Thermoanaerobaculia bacterium]|nr:FAD-binding protein [Thermoanaerobaculia bacterium]
MAIDRRSFLRIAAATAVLARCRPATLVSPAPQTVNDIHSKLNATSVDEVLRPSTVEELRRIVRRAASRREAVAVSGGRHAMGGQQFARDGVVVDTRSLNRAVELDSAAEATTSRITAGRGASRWIAAIRSSGSFSV